MKKIIIAGANGFIGCHLSRYFSEIGWDVVGLARREDGLDATSRYINWDGKNLGDWVVELDGADLVVNLAGRNLNCRHTEDNKKQIIDSRIHSTRVLGQAIAACSKPPVLWMNASGASIYSNMDKAEQGEKGEYGDSFLAEVAQLWEEEFYKAAVPDSVRRVALRTSMVIAVDSGNVFCILQRICKLGLGGQLGTGQQMVSWIHVDDFCKVVQWLTEHGEVKGPINMTAPSPVTNAEMMRRFRKFVGMPIGLPAAGWMVKIGAAITGSEAELILDPLWVTPNVLVEYGYQFKYPEMELEKF